MTEKNESFNVTGEHPIWLQGKGWTQAKDIKRADPIATQTGDILVLQNTRINQPLKVYNFSVANTPNYFVGTQGIWVHNAGNECDIYGGARGNNASYTKPTGVEGGTPSGNLATVKVGASDDNKRSIRRENESAMILANAGYKVHQQPVVPGNKKPDLRIEGKVFDVKAPITSSARNAATAIEDAVKVGQTRRIVLNLEDSDITLDAMKNQLDTWPIEGLKEVIVIKNGEIIPFWHAPN